MPSTALLLFMTIVGSWFVARVPVILAQENAEGESRFSLLDVLVYLPPFRDCFLTPNVCPNKNVSFYLYTSANPNSPYLLDPSKPKTIRNAPLLPGQPIKFLFHGYSGNHDYSPNIEIRPEYLKMSDLNVISIEYGALVKDPCYAWAVRNVPVVAKCTAQLIDMMVTSKKVLLNQFHIIGFSLGAQVSGHIANYIKSGKLERITGLDPAKPLFHGSALRNLDPSDAKFVDVIHTDAGLRGKLVTVGHLDVYVNKGTAQPGCEKTSSFDEESSCSHVRAAQIFAESIHTTVGFWGFQCPNFTQYLLGRCSSWDGTSHQQLIGEYVSKKAAGIYIVLTKDKPPYALGYLKTNGRSVREVHRTKKNIKDENPVNTEESDETMEEEPEPCKEDSGHQTFKVCFH